jgi:hypothetical protein
MVMTILELLQDAFESYRAASLMVNCAAHLRHKDEKHSLYEFMIMVSHKQKHMPDVKQWCCRFTEPGRLRSFGSRSKVLSFRQLE